MRREDDDNVLFVLAVGWAFTGGVLLLDVPNASAAKLDSFWLRAEVERERDGPREVVVVVGCREGGGCGRGFDELVEALLREDVGFVMMGGFAFG